MDLFSDLTVNMGCLIDLYEKTAPNYMCIVIRILIGQGSLQPLGVHLLTLVIFDRNI